MNYYTQHSPFGALASFTVGLPQSRGGMGQSLSGPADQDVYVGFRRLSDQEGGRWNLLPFYQKAEVSAAAAFTVEFADESSNECDEPIMLDIEQVERQLGWATDTWRIDQFNFQIFSPFARTESPETMSVDSARSAFAPRVQAELYFDNRKGTDTVELIFGIGNTVNPFRPLEDARSELVGFALGHEMGFAAKPEDVSRRMQGLSLFGVENYKDHRGLHLLGKEAALVFRVEAGEEGRFPVSIGFFQAGTVTTGLRASYYYTQLFEDLEAVLAYGLDTHVRCHELASQRDSELASNPALDENQKWLISQATHSYLGSTELLWDECEEKPLWVVNEGEYLMINTFDLTVDHLFFELTWHPWAVKNTLDLFVNRYSFTDGLNLPTGGSTEGGISFVHDMGVADHFTAAGHSSYECTHLTGCFSQMTMEQLINWICCASTYALRTNDRDWLLANRATFDACCDSLLRRDHPDAAQRTGLLKFDSDRCGPDGAEITTYDSLDVSLGQARNNLYISVKAFAAWTLLERIYEPDALHDLERQRTARAASDLAAAAVAERYDSDCGMFPAVFEGGNESRILPAVEGLVFPLFLKFSDTLKARYPDLFDKLGAHMKNVLVRGICLDATTGAWKISSTSQNTWFSKISIAQHVVRGVFPELELSEEATVIADATHARMQQCEAVGKYAMVDQVHSAKSEAIGSRYYPRIVTSCLWMNL